MDLVMQVQDTYSIMLFSTSMKVSFTLRCTLLLGVHAFKKSYFTTFKMFNVNRWRLCSILAKPTWHTCGKQVMRNACSCYKLQSIQNTLFCFKIILDNFIYLFFFKFM